jgi:hypothetical protein
MQHYINICFQSNNVLFYSKSNNSTANIYKSYNMGRPSLPVQPPRRESKAITITAPPPPVTPATSADAIAAATAAKAVKENNNPKVNKLLASLEGKPIHEKKQLLGDELFPLVKSTGTKQAPKVTICLLDTVNLAELAEIMYDANTLKKRVQDAFATLQ